MAVHTAVGQGKRSPEARPGLPASPSTAPQDRILQQTVTIAQGESPLLGQQMEQRLARDADLAMRDTELAIGAAVLVTGGALLVTAALFAAGFMRKPIEQAVRRCADRIELVELPLVLPLTFLEVIREMRANSRAVSEIRGQQHAA